MEHKLIQTENYLLVVDDSEIKYDDHFIDEYKMLYMLKNGSIETYKSAKKVIAHLPLNNSPILEGVDLLPPLEDDVEKLAEIHTTELDWDTDDYEKNCARFSFKEGYNKAKEKYKWTDEDVIQIVEKSRNTGLTAEYLMLSLQQPKYPIAFECEIFGYVNPEWNEFPKTLINSQGLTQWVGYYVY